nr:Microfibrillar-associated protein 1 [Polyrhizophydium stewartii]
MLQEQEEAEQLRIKQLEERKIESQNLVDHVLQKEVDELTASAAQILDIDDTDDVDPEEEYNAWKLRELLRIKRDRVEREQREQEQREIERRRNMTDAEIAAEKEAEGKMSKEKIKHKFMQKYYHKGAFFVDDDRVRDALKHSNPDAPTLEDHFDKTLLPEVMQVKNFGRAGRTKYTHLADQDTTQRDSAWSQKTDIARKMEQRLGGMRSDFERPSAKRVKRTGG